MKKEAKKDVKATLENLNLNYHLETEYERTDCNGCEDYCRCTKILNARVENFNLETIVGVYLKALKVERDTVLGYCIWRSFYILGLGHKDAYWVDVSRGYYGEEVNSVKIASPLFDKLSQMIDSLIQVSSDDMELIRRTLVLEYGYILDKVEKLTKATLEEVSLDSVRPAQTEHYMKVNQAVVDSYKENKMPIGLVIHDEGDKLRIVDGYHRYAAAKTLGRSKVKVIVLS